MATVKSVDKLRKEAVQIIKIFTANPKLEVTVNQTTYTGAELGTLDASVAAADKAVEDKRAELTPLLNDRDTTLKLYRSVLVQSRKAIAGFYGEDSSEYELAGGKRTSERKSPGRRIKATPTPSTPAAAG